MERGKGAALHRRKQGPDSGHLGAESGDHHLLPFAERLIQNDDVYCSAPSSPSDGLKFLETIKCCSRARKCQNRVSSHLTWTMAMEPIWSRDGCIVKRSFHKQEGTKYQDDHPMVPRSSCGCATAFTYTCRTNKARLPSRLIKCPSCLRHCHLYWWGSRS